VLFAAIYTPRDSVTEEQQKRSLQLFTSWTPPFEFKSHYARGDGEGGIAILESETADAVIEGISPWAPFFKFDITPVIDIEQAIPLFQRGYEWRDSVR
jgi:hypothetical protein